MSTEILMSTVPLDKLTSDQLYELIGWLGDRVSSNTPLQNAVLKNYQEELLYKLKREPMKRKVNG